MNKREQTTNWFANQNLLCISPSRVTTQKVVYYCLFIYIYNNNITPVFICIVNMNFMSFVSSLHFDCRILMIFTVLYQTFTSLQKHLIIYLVFSSYYVILTG